MPDPETLVAAVADAGPLIHLDELDALAVLSGFDQVLVPSVVATEVFATAPAGRRERRQACASSTRAHRP